MKGDRFIPNRSLMDLDRAHTLLTNPSKELGKSKYNVSISFLISLNECFWLLFSFFFCPFLEIGNYGFPLCM